MKSQIILHMRELLALSVLCTLSNKLTGISAVFYNSLMMHYSFNVCSIFQHSQISWQEFLHVFTFHLSCTVHASCVGYSNIIARRTTIFLFLQISALMFLYLLNKYVRNALGILLASNMFWFQTYYYINVIFED